MSLFQKQLKTFGGIHNILLKRGSDTEAHIHFDLCFDEIVFRTDQNILAFGEIGNKETQ